MIQPSCQALLVLDDDAFRKNLIAALDQHNFAVTFSEETDSIGEVLSSRTFRVIVVGLDLRQGKGTRTLDYLREHREVLRCGVLILGEPDPNIRNYAPWADETFLKPVDPAYVATRARSYCAC